MIGKKHFLAMVERKMTPQLISAIFVITPFSEKVQVIELNKHSNRGAITAITKVQLGLEQTALLKLG